MAIEVYEGTKFTWSGTQGIVDHSDMGWKVLPTQFDVRSTKTGIVKTFIYENARTDRENEVVAWVYRTLDKKIYIHVIND
jgi:hypothetical protein